jgi:hypothetical protein
MNKYEVVLQSMLGVDLWGTAIEEQAILAGGMLTRIFSDEDWYAGDLDLFFRTRGQTRNFTGSLREYNYGESETIPGHGYGMILTKTGEPNLHIIENQVHPNGAKSVISGFDLSVCMEAYDFGKGKFVFGETFLQDVQNREFTIHKLRPENLTNHLLRIIKYLNRGYELLNPEILEKYREERNKEVSPI